MVISIHLTPPTLQNYFRNCYTLIFLPIFGTWDAATNFLAGMWKKHTLFGRKHTLFKEEDRALTKKIYPVWFLKSWSPLELDTGSYLKINSFFLFNTKWITKLQTTSFIKKTRSKVVNLAMADVCVLT